MAIRFTPQALPVVPDPKPRVKQVQTLRTATVVSDTGVKQPAEVSDVVKHDASAEAGVKQFVGMRLPPDLAEKVAAKSKELRLNRTQTIIALLRKALP